MGKLVAVTEPGVSLAAEGERLVIRRGGKTGETFRLADLDQVLLFGPVEVTHAALMRLLAHGVDVVYLTGSGSFRGRLQGHLGRNIELRLAQFRRLQDEAFAFAVARAIVAGKIANQRRLLVRAQQTLAEDLIAAELLALRHRIRDAQRARDREELLGVEGAAAASYFRAFGRAIKNPLFSFSGRTRRPPRDPVNACLSFGYALAGTLLDGDVTAAGLDPMFGAFHQPSYGRPSLALDLLEEFRPVLVDALVLRLVNRRQLVPADFASPAEALGQDQLAVEGHDLDGAVYLASTGRKVFLAEFLRRLREEAFYPTGGGRYSYRDIMRHQVYHLARVIKGEDAVYLPFEMR